jgi:hypothetical protein
MAAPEGGGRRQKEGLRGRKKKRRQGKGDCEEEDAGISGASKLGGSSVFGGALGCSPIPPYSFCFLK